MIHKNFIVRGSGDVVHIFEIVEFKPPIPPMLTFKSRGVWSYMDSVCGGVYSDGPVAEAGDGRPVCRKCADRGKEGMDMSQKTCIVVRRRCCNRIFFVCAEESIEQDDKEKILQYAKSGHKAERMTLEEFNKEGFGDPCDCNKKNLELTKSLFEEVKP